MKILLLSNSASEHTQKWALGLARNGIEVGIFSLNRSEKKWYEAEPLITILHEPGENKGNSRLSTKLGYVFYLRKLKKAIRVFKPDILHAHYATSYGMLGSLSEFNPFVISVWGSDVYDFPVKSTARRIVLKKILASAELICSTSNSMKDQTEQYTKRPVRVVPFGIDPAYFAVENRNHTSITIGTIKSLEEKYGIDLLIRSFLEVQKRFSHMELNLLIVGDGSKRAEYESLVQSLGIQNKVTFAGRIPHEQIVGYHDKIDIFVSLSILDSESFGVSLVEAMAMAKPIVASDVSGFKEVLGNEECGILVPRNSVEAAVEAIAAYIADPESGKRTGANARVRAMKLYNWNNNLDEMIDIYSSLNTKKKSSKSHVGH
ncbi:MAG: hypothetical protein K0S33_2414 [Bacteroidetes bacterium]|jgi:glycosyltransferase involved in cell wall biosynthesis|nr:hypothetical protein [Bacteroidota bacterium]